MDVAEWDERYRSHDHLWSVTPNLFVADRLSGMAPGRGLDLAAGEGRNAIWLASLGWEMTAVDFSEVAISKGKAQSEAVDFVVADVRTWETEQSFDLVLIAYLHLVPGDYEAIVRRARDWLAPGGELFLIGHDVSNPTDGWGGPQYPELLWDVSEVLGWLDGLVIVEAEVVNRPVDTDEGRKYARDTLVRARAA
ncbi:MAG TPA: class I SAM-dependent methyltransferase [Acidimicrobiia bacterium]|jgi:SAM-dependent methyltransferase|nr:Methyltransferase type 12 [Acidimicrobiia bacterium]HYJ24411.1 class I SAM-dependent methyltransferase [Acidimicrobiia bacterium]